MNRRRIWTSIPLQIIFFVLVISMMVSFRSEAASIRVKYNGKKYTYGKVINTIYINGKKKTITATPVFLMSDAYVGPAGLIFKDVLKLDYSSDLLSSPKKLTIKNGSNTLLMTSGSRYGVWNGKSDKMGREVWYLKYLNSGKDRWVVPLNSVCSRLGLSYKVKDGAVYINTKDYENKLEADDTEDSDLEEAASQTTRSKTEATTSSSSSTTSSKKKIVLVLDAGHGGKDTGARGNGYIEKNMTLKIVKAAKNYFDKDKHFKVYYTRVTDVYPTLQNRYKLANSKKADLFISVHINSYRSTSTGTETLYSKARNGITKKNGISSLELASCMQSYARNATGFYNRGLKNRPKLWVLKYTKMPACLIEYGFISNKKEAVKMNKNLSNYGRALYNGVVRLTKNNGLYK